MVSSEKNNLSNHFYSTLEEEERGKRRREALFAVLLALQLLGEALLSLSEPPSLAAPMAWRCLLGSAGGLSCLGAPVLRKLIQVTN